MIIEIIDGDWYTVKLTNSNGDVSQRKFDTYPEVMAHALELPVEDILSPDDWDTQMTRDHASLYLDILEAQHKKMQKQKGAWGWLT